FDNSVAELQGASSPIYLILKPAGTKLPSAIRDYRRHWTPIHLDFAVEDIAAAVARAIAAGAKLEGQIESFLWGQQASFSDPFGHGFCLIEFTASGYNAAR
ncbi:MAG TPA: VOC family protein, partial [Candidatus Binatia bacterium]|nr:VOC family protein [Candidatus Binatia bacterium]